FVAVAVEKGDRELRLLQPIVVRGLAERRNRQRQHQQKAAGAERRPLGHDLYAEPTPARDMEAVHIGRIALVEFAQPYPGAKYRRIEPRVEVEQEALEPRRPVLVKKVAHDIPQAGDVGGARGAAKPVNSFTLLAYPRGRSQWP